MKLTDIMARPEKALLYMERLVNNGSPSNFSFVNITSKWTSPLYVENFNLCCVEADESNLRTFGACNYKFFNCNLMLLHPDWKYFNTEMNIDETNIQVAPTSSSRTVKVLDSDIYIKLGYPGILGRITRELRKEHILSSIDVSEILYKLISDELVPDVFAFFPEKCGKLFERDCGDIGYVIREAKPFGKKSSQIHAIIPAFSLFSDDRRTKDDIPIIIQILNYKEDKIKYLLYQLIFPIIDCYFSCVFNGGIQLELHAQNFLIGIDLDLNVVGIIIRDLESADKDLTIMKKNQYSFELRSKPYKCIEDGEDNYFIKHSFMYDHKLGEYFFDQLLKCVEKYGVVSEGVMQKKIKEYVVGKYGVKLEGYFPEDRQWYKFQNVLIDRTKKERPYISFSNLKYR